MVSQEHRKRQETIRKFCAAQHPNYTIPSTIRRYFSFSERYRLVYCSIQKVGSSFWLQVMKWLIGQRKAESFFGVKTFHHSTGIRGYYSFLNKTEAETAKLLRSYKKFLFVRDPLSRIFSAYMDKVFVPDPRMFFLAGRRRVRQGKAEEGVGEEGGEGGSDWRKCLLNVTFQAFLTAITSGGKQDPHWYSMHRHCEPCSVDFDYIGRMETFIADTEFILGQMGVNLSFLPPRDDSFDSENDLMALRDLAHRVLHIAYKRGCPSETFMCQVFRRIWVTLLTRGFISKDVAYPFPERRCAGINETSFIEKLVEAYRQSGNRAERMRQRQEALMEAYCRVPRWLLRKVEEYVRDDCAMFGYNCFVDSRFPEGEMCTRKTSYFDGFI